MELVTRPALGTLIDREATDGETTRRKATGWQAAGTPLALAVVMAAVATGRAGRRTSWAGGFLDTPRGPLGYAVVVEAGAAARGDGRAISTAIGETR